MCFSNLSSESRVISSNFSSALEVSKTSWIARAISCLAITGGAWGTSKEKLWQELGFGIENEWLFSKVYWNKDPQYLVKQHLSKPYMPREMVTTFPLLTLEITFSKSFLWFYNHWVKQTDSTLQKPESFGIFKNCIFKY